MSQVASSKAAANGVLPIPVSATQKNTTTAQPKRSSAKAPAQRLKLLIRRLPPGLTQTEFETAIGEKWKLGGEKVDWFLYKHGKISKDPSKPSRPARAYLRVTAQSHVAELSDEVRMASFLDSANTSKDSVLLGPPSLEFAPFGRVTGGRVRKDARQGTIDQDPEFIDFLESLTNPVIKPANDTAADADSKDEKVTTTPLIQFLKEKKANKGKDSGASTKSSKHGRMESKDTKSEKVQSKKLLSRADKEVTPTAEKQIKPEKTVKEGSKATNKQAQNANVKATPKIIARSPSKTNASTPSTPVEKKRERGNVSAAAKILQRDLGLATGGGRRRTAKAGGTESPSQLPETDNLSAKSPVDGSKSSSTSAKAVPSPKPTPPKTDAKSTPPTGPAATRGGKRSQNQSQNSAQNQNPASVVSTGTTSNQGAKPKQDRTQTPASKPNPTPSAGSTQAFLKHANPSQGVTESLLEAAFTPFGKLLKVEIDKKKGFGYLDFEDHESLKKAMASSPVKVAQGQVVVLERKSGTAVAQARGGNRSASANANATASAPKSGATSQNAPNGQNTSNAQSTAPAKTVNNSPANRGSHRRGRRGQGGGGGGGGQKASGNAASQPSTPTTSTPTTDKT